MAITSSVSSFLGKVNQGVRPNLFLATINFPNTAGSVDLPTGTEEKDFVNMLCKSAALPASNLGVIEVPFRGRTVKVAGDRTFDTWTATFINDRNFQIRHAMERWMRTINAHEANTAELIVPNASAGYTADITIQQLERDSTAGGSTLSETINFGVVSQPTFLKLTLLMIAMTKLKILRLNSNYNTGQ